MILPPAVTLNGSVGLLRNLGEHGVKTTAVTDLRWTVVAHSRYIDEVRKAPAGNDRFTEWFANEQWAPGSVIIPGGDEDAWWLARWSGANPNASSVAATPGLAPIRSMLVKHRMIELAHAHGISTPRTWLMDSGAVGSASEVIYPSVVKPQCRVGLQHWTRGRVVRNRHELDIALDWFSSECRYAPAVVQDDPTIVHSLVQEFVARPSHEVYHLVGYRSRAGEMVVASHRKFFQHPMRFGSGLCFESSEVDADEAARLERLLAGIEFHGIFEAEYLERDGKKLLIDLNPRSYNGLSLETKRGYDLPWYLYLDTIGESAALVRELSAARSRVPASFAWCDSVRYWTMLAGQSVSGGLPLAETKRWVEWSWRNRKRTIDPFFEKGDRGPGFAFLGEHLASVVRHPRAFLGTYVRRGLDR